MVPFARLCSAVGIILLFQLNNGLSAVDGSRILGYFITPSRSHFIIQDALMRGLADKGHNVTVISLFAPPKETIPNYRYIQIPMSTEASAMWLNITSNWLDSAANKEPYLYTLPKLLRTIDRFSVESLRHPIMQRLRSDEHFDLVVLGYIINDYQIGLAAEFNCPAVLVATVPAFGTLRSYVGHTTNPSHNPSVLMPFAVSAPMAFWQRCVSVALWYVEAAFSAAMMRYHFTPIYEQEFPPDRFETFADARKRVALVMATQHFSQAQPTADFPSLIDISGMHIPKTPNALPEAIQSWLDTSNENGVIYFSMGSNIRSDQITADRRAAILRVFARLPQRILWKWDENLDSTERPANVMVLPWLPQADILAHRNVRLFITHCGKGSLNEARVNGVPVLGIPVFGDQMGNLMEIQKEGWAVPLQYANLTEQAFEAAVREALTNPSYGNVVRKAAQLFTDRPMHPMDNAIWWVEYVLRHGGAKHMQSAAVHLNWVEYYSVDVWTLFAGVVWLVWNTTLWFWQVIWSCVLRRGSDTVKKNQ